MVLNNKPFTITYIAGERRRVRILKLLRKRQAFRGEREREPLVPSSLSCQPKTFGQWFTRLFRLFDIISLISRKTKFATENLKRNCHQMCMSFNNALQQKGYVRSAAGLSDEDRFYGGCSEPPIPTSRGQHPRSITRLSTMINTPQTTNQTQPPSQPQPWTNNTNHNKTLQLHSSQKKSILV